MPLTSAKAHSFPGARGPWARFDGPAGTQMVDTAIEAMARFLRSGDSANTGGLFEAAVATAQVVCEARMAVAELLEADPEGVVFGANSTSLILSFVNWISPTLHPGDVVLCSQLDHDANIAPWLWAAQTTGAEVRMLPLDTESGRLHEDAVDELCDKRVRWVAITGASNVIGTIPDVQGIVAAAHRYGARVVVDAVHLVPHRPVHVAELGCDAIVTSPYKWYGPHCGVMWLSPELRSELQPLNVRAAPAEAPGRFETGTLPIEALVGVAVAARYLLEVRADEGGQREHEVFSSLLGGLLEMSHVTVVGPPNLQDRTSTVAFTVDGHTPAEVSSVLAAKRIAVWNGHNYAVELMRAYGLWETGGVVRAGVVHYTTSDDVSRLLDAVEALKI